MNVVSDLSHGVVTCPPTRNRGGGGGGGGGEGVGRCAEGRKGLGRSR